MERQSLNIGAIDNVLEIFAETNIQPALRASLSLSRLMMPVQESAWPDVNNCFSRLTGDGFPLEFSFSSAMPDIRYTTEIAGPEIPESVKVKMAASLLAERSPVPMDDKIAEMTGMLAQQPGLRYGAWMGGRHGPRQDDRYKIYLEITEACRNIGDAFLQPLIGNRAMVNRENYRLRMIGIDSVNKWEYYFRLFKMDTWQLLYLFRCLGFAEQGRDLLDFIASFSEKKIDRTFIGNNLGIGIATEASGKTEALSIFTFPYKIVEPGDKYLRTKLLEFSDRVGWDFTNYARVTEPIAQNTGRLTNHGLVTFSTSRTGTKIVQVGLRPPQS